MNNPKKILIVKTGFTEVLDTNVSTNVSFGDVLSCTALLPIYTDDHVTWVTSKEASLLLKNNTLIDCLEIFDGTVFQRLEEQAFDVVINLEKDISIAVFLMSVSSKEQFGFYFDYRDRKIMACNPALEYLVSGQEHQRNIDKNIFEIIFDIVGEVWDGQGSILNRPEKIEERFDIGFNYAVGTKWPTKTWPMDKWEKLETLLKDQFSISWQKGFDDLQEYVDWIDQCRLVVTSDSLGQFIAQALGKQVMTLVGPTNQLRLARIPNMTLIHSTLACPHAPCYLPACKHDSFCMDYIAPEAVAEKCIHLLAEERVYL